MKSVKEFINALPEQRQKKIRSKAAKLADEIESLAEQILEYGPVGSIALQEISKGYQPIARDEYPWYTSADWSGEAVVTRDVNRVRIVLVNAINPGHGAFSRMITNILQDGLLPVVIAPLGTMCSIMHIWGWRMRRVGTTFHEREEQWFPMRGWINKRLEKK